MLPQTSDEGLNPHGLLSLSSVAICTGIVIKTEIRASRLNVEPYELNCAIQRVGILLMPACTANNNAVNRNVCHAFGSYVGFPIDTAASIIAARE